MALPIFESTQLIDIGGIEVWGSFNSRFLTGSLPGVNGVFLQVDGFGGQQMTLVGVLEAATLPLIEGRVNNRQVLENDTGTYTGTGGEETQNMTIIRVSQIGQFIPITGGTYNVRVRYDFLRLTPG